MRGLAFIVLTAVVIGTATYGGMLGVGHPESIPFIGLSLLLMIPWFAALVSGWAE